MRSVYAAFSVHTNTTPFANREVRHSFDSPATSRSVTFNVLVLPISRSKASFLNGARTDQLDNGSPSIPGGGKICASCIKPSPSTAAIRLQSSKKYSCNSGMTLLRTASSTCALDSQLIKKACPMRYSRPIRYSIRWLMVVRTALRSILLHLAGSRREPFPGS